LRISSAASGEFIITHLGFKNIFWMRPRKATGIIKNGNDTKWVIK
jgi:hypothetical protein